MHMYHPYIICICVLFILPWSVHAETMSSESYQVQHGTFGSGGISNSSSETFLQQSVLGETILGEDSSSANYGSSAGFEEIQGAGSTASEDTDESSGSTSGGRIASRGSTNDLSTTTDTTPEIDSSQKSEQLTPHGSTMDAHVGEDTQLENQEEDIFPEQQFSITLMLDPFIVRDMSQLSARIAFEHFGTQPTPVDVIYSILDSEGNEVYRDEGQRIDIVVETRGLLQKSFEGVELLSGGYTLVVEVLYNDTHNELRQSFQVQDPLFILNPLYLWFMLGALGLLMLGIFLLYRRSITS